MNRIELTDYPELYNIGLQRKHGNIVQSAEWYLQSIGYKSITWIPVTYYYELSDEEYTWFLLRWS